MPPGCDDGGRECARHLSLRVGRHGHSILVAVAWDSQDMNLPSPPSESELLSAESRYCPREGGTPVSVDTAFAICAPQDYLVPVPVLRHMHQQFEGLTSCVDLSVEREAYRTY